MTTYNSISDLPKSPAVYALYGGTGRSRYVAYVGIAKNLRGRIEQHLVRQDSSVATGTTAACLNPDYVTEVCFWKHRKFVSHAGREAGELVAYDVLNPALRSRGAVTKRGRELYEDKSFYEEMEELFRGEPRGRLEIVTLEDALERIAALEDQLATIKKALRQRP